MSDELSDRIDKLAVRNRPLVLVVDDNPDCFELVKLTLHYCDVFWAPSGEKALEILATRGDEFKVVLVDERMPSGMPGHVFLERIKEKWPYKSVAVLTGLDISEDERNGFLRAGAFSVITKPLKDHPEEIDRFIRMFLD